MLTLYSAHFIPPKWTEYHHWSLLAKLGRVRVLAKVGQSGLSTEVARFKYQAQNRYFHDVGSELKDKTGIIDSKN